MRSSCFEVLKVTISTGSRVWRFITNIRYDSSREMVPESLRLPCQLKLIFVLDIEVDHTNLLVRDSDDAITTLSVMKATLVRTPLVMRLKCTWKNDDRKFRTSLGRIFKLSRARRLYFAFWKLTRKSPCSGQTFQVKIDHRMKYFMISRCHLSVLSRRRDATRIVSERTLENSSPRHWESSWLSEICSRDVSWSHTRVLFTYFCQWCQWRRIRFTANDTVERKRAWVWSDFEVEDGSDAIVFSCRVIPQTKWRSIKQRSMTLWRLFLKTALMTKSITMKQVIRRQDRQDRDVEESFLIITKSSWINESQ